MRIREAQKHTDHTDPEGWFQEQCSDDDKSLGLRIITLITELGLERNSMTSCRSGSRHWTPGIPDIPETKTN
jgi:hypothetical protein